MWFEQIRFDIASLEMVAFQHPEWMFLILVLFALIQEDLATVSIALMAAHGHIPIELGLLAAMTGILIGDMGLFGMGWFARGHRYALRILARHRVRRVKRLMRNHLILTIMAVRCLPGMRLPTYFALGFFHASPWKFGLVAVGAIMLWSVFLFFLAYIVGDQILKTIEGPWFWVAVIGSMGLLFVVPQLFIRRLAILRAITAEKD